MTENEVLATQSNEDPDLISLDDETDEELKPAKKKRKLKETKPTKPSKSRAKTPTQSNSTEKESNKAVQTITKLTKRKSKQPSSEHPASSKEMISDLLEIDGSKMIVDEEPDMDDFGDIEWEDAAQTNGQIQPEHSNPQTPHRVQGEEHDIELNIVAEATPTDPEQEEQDNKKKRKREILSQLAKIRKGSKAERKWASDFHTMHLLTWIGYSIYQTKQCFTNEFQQAVILSLLPFDLYSRLQAYTISSIISNHNNKEMKYENWIDAIVELLEWFESKFEISDNVRSWNHSIKPSKSKEGFQEIDLTMDSDDQRASIPEKATRSAHEGSTSNAPYSVAFTPYVWFNKYSNTVHEYSRLKIPLECAWKVFLTLGFALDLPIRPVWVLDDLIVPFRFNQFDERIPRIAYRDHQFQAALLENLMFVFGDSPLLFSSSEAPQMAKNKRQNSKKSLKDQEMDIDVEGGINEEAEEAVQKKSRNNKKRKTKIEEDTEDQEKRNSKAVNSTTSPSPIRWVPKVWFEVFCSAENRWIQVDIVRKLIDHPTLWEAAFAIPLSQYHSTKGSFLKESAGTKPTATSNGTSKIAPEDASIAIEDDFIEEDDQKKRGKKASSGRKRKAPKPGHAGYMLAIDPFVVPPDENENESFVDSNQNQSIKPGNSSMSMEMEADPTIIQQATTPGNDIGTGTPLKHPFSRFGKLVNVSPRYCNSLYEPMKRMADSEWFVSLAQSYHNKCKSKHETLVGKSKKLRIRNSMAMNESSSMEENHGLLSIQNASTSSSSHSLPGLTASSPSSLASLRSREAKRRMKFFERMAKCDLKEIEQIAKNEPLPTTVDQFKDHPIYVLEKQLLKFEMLRPDREPAIAVINGNPVYLRKDVSPIHTADKWIQLSQQVKKGEEPVKIMKKRSISNYYLPEDEAEMSEYYGGWQTEPYEPSAAVNGVVPKNKFGNVYMFQPQMLPKGTVHLHGMPGLNKICKKIGIDIAPAMVGWSIQNSWSVPELEGWIVCEENAEVAVDAWNADAQRRIEEEAKKEYEKARQNWIYLTKQLLLKQKLDMEHSTSSTHLSTSALPGSSSSLNKAIKKDETSPENGMSIDPSDTKSTDLHSSVVFDKIGNSNKTKKKDTKSLDASTKPPSTGLHTHQFPPELHEDLKDGKTRRKCSLCGYSDTVMKL